MNNTEIVPQEEGTVVSIDGKALDFSTDTKRRDASGIISKLVQFASIGNTIANIDKRVEYVVQIPLKHKEAFEAGELLINKNAKSGVMWPTLYKTLDNGKRQFVDNLPIKQEEILHGNPFQSIAQSYHSLYLQQQINELAEMINKTYKVVERIEQGQKDDRIGILLAGRDQIILSLNLNPNERQTAIQLGRNQILTAQKQLLQTFKRRISLFEALPESSFKRFWLELKHSGTLQERDRDFEEIQEYYSLYLQATQMLATSYTICGQVDEAEKVFQIAEQDMAEIDFDAVKTLRFIHKKNDDMLYYHAKDYISVEKDICLEDAKEYEYITFNVSGEELLEAYENGRKQKIQDSETE